MLVNLGLVNSCKNEHVTKLGVNGSKNVGNDKPMCSRALIIHVGAVFRGANTVERDSALNGATDTQACKSHHFCLVR
jgi:hypothetical protein